MIADANVLIDYLEGSPEILALVARHLGPVYVAQPVLDNVKQLTIERSEQLGLIIAEPTTGQLVEVGRGVPGLAFDDVVCLVMARDHRWCCVTNDKALRKACSRADVHVSWGLQVMLGLIDRAVVSAEKACETARSIRKSNPHFITEAVVDGFVEQARAAETRALSRKGASDGQEPPHG